SVAAGCFVPRPEERFITPPRPSAPAATNIPRPRKPLREDALDACSMLHLFQSAKPAESLRGFWRRINAPGDAPITLLIERRTLNTQIDVCLSFRPRRAEDRVGLDLPLGGSFMLAA